MTKQKIKNQIFKMTKQKITNQIFKMIKQKIKNQIEVRYLNFWDSKLEYRGEGDNKKPYMVGHAAVFNTLSENLGGFRELIHANAFDDVLEDDVQILLNRDENEILASTKSGTLNLSIDDKGLRYELEIPNTTAGRDLLVYLERGDVTEVYSGFEIAEDNWDKSSLRRWIRTITKAERLNFIYVNV